MIKTIDHIGIAVKDLEKSLYFWKNMFGLQDFGIEKIESHGVRVVRLEGETGPSLELISPIGRSSPIEKFLKDRGEGIHHLCFRVPDIQAAMDSLQRNGVEFVDKKPREGAEGGLVAFIYPRHFNGVLIELKEEK